MNKKIFGIIVMLLMVCGAYGQSRVYNAYGYYYYANSHGYYSFPYHDDVYYIPKRKVIYVDNTPQVIVHQPQVIYEQPVVVERPVYIKKPVYIEKEVTVEEPVYHEVVGNTAYYADNRHVRVNGFETFDENVATQWTLVFNIGSYKLTTAALPDLHNIRKFYQTYPNCSFEILAYSDRKTGSASSNMILSRQRGEAIAKYLNEVKGIPFNKLTVDCYGSDQQVYVNNDWNRCVIVRAVF